MDDDDLDTSECYRDAQSFRALRKRKSKTDSTAGSSEKLQQTEQSRGFAPGCFRKEGRHGGKSL